MHLKCQQTAIKFFFWKSRNCRVIDKKKLYFNVYINFIKV